MKRRFKYILTLVSIVGLLSGCSDYETASANAPAVVDEEGNYFTTMYSWRENGNWYYLVYANDTKVKYLSIKSTAYSGITPLFNADGTLQIYEGTSEKDCTCDRCINN